MSRITESDLLKYNFDCSRLRQEGGFNVFQLKDCCFDADDLKNAGFSAIELRCAGFNAEALRLGGYSVLDVSSAGFTPLKLREAGFNAQEIQSDLHLNESDLKTAGFGAEELRDVGYRAKELKDIGFSAIDLQPFYPPEELIRSGFTKDDLQPIGAWKHDGQWQIYNQYWSCCFSLEKNSHYCIPLKNSDNLRNTQLLKNVSYISQAYKLAED